MFLRVKLEEKTWDMVLNIPLITFVTDFNVNVTLKAFNLPIFGKGKCDGKVSEYTYSVFTPEVFNIVKIIVIIVLKLLSKNSKFELQQFLLIAVIIFDVAIICFPS